ncbi:MAG: hypothetical protein WKF97_15190 [Chitinophagaceae bacterium]
MKNTLNTSPGLEWIQTLHGIPYFFTEQGKDWIPIGQNDAITWPELAGLFLRKDPGRVDAYFKMLVGHGVTCIRLMLEYCQTDHRYLEKPVGRFQQNMVRLWDDIFTLCERHGLRILLTPYDTFWMRRRWRHHPYNQAKGGPCTKRSQWLLCPDTRSAIKNRLSFATERWGNSGALFAWDLWNEIRPAHGGNSVSSFSAFIEDVGGFLKMKELELHGRSHPQTVSFFGTSLASDGRVSETAFRHSSLDFVNLHFYEDKSLDSPQNTTDAAITTGNLTRKVLQEITDARPFFDSEHGPIHTFNRRRKTLAETFDDEYFRHMQWAHFASGGAGGGMRWPYRHPHMLTPGMRKAQLALASFLPLITFKDFKRRNLNHEIRSSDPGIARFGCGDDVQAIIWLMRTDSIGKKGLLEKKVHAKNIFLYIPFMKKGCYQVTAWDTKAGIALYKFLIEHKEEDMMCFPLLPILSDLALAVRPVPKMPCPDLLWAGSRNELTLRWP